MVQANCVQANRYTNFGRRLKASVLAMSQNLPNYTFNEGSISATSNPLVIDPMEVLLQHQVEGT